MLVIPSRSRHSQSNATLFHRLGALGYEQGELGLAAVALDRVLELSPTNTEAMVLMAIVRANQGRFAEAQAVIDAASQIEPENPTF